MRTKWREQWKATKSRCPDTGKANLQNHGIFGRKMHMAIVRRHSGEAMLLLLNIHGLRRPHGGTRNLILKKNQVSPLMILQGSSQFPFLYKEQILQIHSMWILELDLQPQHQHRVKLLILQDRSKLRTRQAQHNSLPQNSLINQQHLQKHPPIQPIKLLNVPHI